MDFQINDKLVKLPDFLIVGTGKAGTTSLHHYLNEHLEIFMPSVKETLFWQIISNPNKTPLKLNPNAVTSFEDYTQMFAEATDDQLCGESCPSYLYYHEYTIANLKKYHPKWNEVKIIIVLREPVSKVISQYYFVTNTLKIPESSLEEALKLEKSRLKENIVSPSQFYVDSTLYYEQVKAFMENFKHVKVLFYEDLKKDRHGFINEICDFLGIAKVTDAGIATKKFNVSKRKRVPRTKFLKVIIELGKPLLPKRLKQSLKRSFDRSIGTKLFKEEQINKNTIAHLKNIFAQEIKQLENLLGRNLNFWKYD